MRFANDAGHGDSSSSVAVVATPAAVMPPQRLGSASSGESDDARPPASSMSPALDGVLDAERPPSPDHLDPQSAANGNTSSALHASSGSDEDSEAQYHFTPAIVTTPLEHVPDMEPGSQAFSWSAAAGQSRTSRGSIPLAPNQQLVNGGPEPLPAPVPFQLNAAGMNSARAPRPSAVRTPSNAYAPSAQRRPTQYSLSSSSGGAAGRHRNSSTNRGRRNPNAEYRAQEKAYVQRIRQDVPEHDELFEGDLRTPSLGYSSDSISDEESPATAEYLDNDPYDQETLLYYGNEDMLPSMEELKIPANRERLEWHAMLASVLTGDVVKQEKRRLIGGGEQKNDSTFKAEMWVGIRARYLGRQLNVQRKILDENRSKTKALIESIIAFEIQGEAEVGQTPLQQVESILHKMEKVQSLYPTTRQLIESHPRAGSVAWVETCDAIISWYNTTKLIETELRILQNWVGNEELDFTKPRVGDPNDNNLSDDSSFIERLLKEDGLKSLQGEDSLLYKLKGVIHKAKSNFIENSKAFTERHLPPYMEELQTLINFPSRLVQEIIKMRLSYAKKIRDPTQQGVMMAESMIAQFQILLTLAVRIKEEYNVISRPEVGWDPPDCIEENFDVVVLDALKFYFRMLNWKLSANKNTFREAEILEQEWDFSVKLGRHLEDGDVEVAEQFSSLTSKSLLRLTTHFEKELQIKPEELGGPDMEKRYKGMLDSVRVRQRKLFRFSRILTQRFENCTEYNINIKPGDLSQLYESLAVSGHFLVENPSLQDLGIYIIASPSLWDSPRLIHSLLGTCYHVDETNPDDPDNPYVLIFKPEDKLYWSGKKLELAFKQPHLDLKTSRLRLVADGSQQRLADAKIAFLAEVGMDLTVLIEQRANLPRVYQELQRIKRTAYKLSNTIMDSVEIIRKQTQGLECQELIQTCFGFATEFGQRSLLYMNFNQRAMNNAKLTSLALDWIAFIADDCVASDRRTFRWAVTALEFAMVMTRGQNILGLSESDYARLRSKVAGCMSVLISHFDIMGARSTMAAQAEKQRQDAALGKGSARVDVSHLRDDDESAALMMDQIKAHIEELEACRKQKETERQAFGRVLEDSNEADRALTYLTSSAMNSQIRWQQGQYVGGGTFGSVYAAVNLDTGQYMAVKEIRLQDPQLIPQIVTQIRDEMTILQVLDHPNIVSYYGIEPHRDKVYIFMEYCSGGSLAALLEHGRIEDEMVTLVYALQMLEGLAYLHDRGIVHRDIKPESEYLLFIENAAEAHDYRYSL